MASDYDAIRARKKGEYPLIHEWGPTLLQPYGDSVHFIFELLQNAEDALSKRNNWRGPHKVSFELTQEALKISHYGKPFDEADVNSICSVVRSTKDEQSIGRFGIGFKSVYKITDRPEIHSGEEDFYIDMYVHPHAVEKISRNPEETIILLPLEGDSQNVRGKIISGFKSLGPRALLFLRSVKEIEWSVQDGPSGLYMRDEPESISKNVDRVKLIGCEEGGEEIDEEWLVFHREVFSPEKTLAGRIEIAFSLQNEKNQSAQLMVNPVHKSFLVVFFPTVIETNLGFLIQGPYRTTPGRDNIERDDSWNESLIKQTATLLVEALRWMRDESILNRSVLDCLPLEREKFADDLLFAPLFKIVHEALAKEPLLPRFGGGYVSASEARLARTQTLRELFNSKQITQLFGGKASAWLSNDITRDLAPKLMRYLTHELEMALVVPQTILPLLTRGFMEAQDDSWILKLYEFLKEEKALQSRLDSVPLLRLTDSTHIVAFDENGEPNAFLPGRGETGFRTISQSVCSTDDSIKFLRSLGITEPDPVADVIQNVLPKYQQDEIGVNDEEYEQDINKILSAFNTDSKERRRKLVENLQKTNFVVVIDANSGKESFSTPNDVYLSTDRLKKLFEGVPGVLIVSDAYGCLHGDPIRELLEGCGAVRYVRPLPNPDYLSHEKLADLRRSAGQERSNGYDDKVEDWVLDGFDELLEILPRLEPKDRIERARLIWKSLTHLGDRRGSGIFDGEYRWSYFRQPYNAIFPAAFITQLNDAKWVPDETGELQQPRFVRFDELDWKNDPVLLTKIHFKPPVVDQLAEEAGFEPGALDLLQKLGITSVADLKKHGISEPTPSSKDATHATEEGSHSEDESNDIADGATDVHDPNGGGDYGPNDGGDARNSVESRGHESDAENRKSVVVEEVNDGKRSNRKPNNQRGSQPSSSRGKHQFISYIGVHPDEKEPDPEGLSHEVRMKVEDRATDEILKSESALKQAPKGNKGFDLYEGEFENPSRWVEVKSLSEGWKGCSVCMSKAQFDLAREKRDAYWLYVVEYVSNPEKTNILKIRDPAGQAQHFTFDHGWADIGKPIT